MPLIKSGLFAGGTIVFIWAFTDLGTPLIFDYSSVTSVQIYYGLKDIGGNLPVHPGRGRTPFLGHALRRGKGLFGSPW